MTGYALTVVKTKTGESISGIVKESSETKIVLAAAGELRHTIAKSDIQEQLTSPASMMPPYLHAGLSKDEFSDLIAFLESLKQNKLRDKQSTPLEIQRLSKPVKLVPVFGAGLNLHKPVWFGEHPVIEGQFIVLEKSKARLTLLGKKRDGSVSVSYTHLTLPTNREV